MAFRSAIASFVLWSVVSIGYAGQAFAQEKPASLPRLDDKPRATGKPIKVFVLMGQSNMVGM